jgi:hypothetical protein
VSARHDIEDEEDREAEQKAASLKDQLSKDVAAWSKGRREQSAEHAAELRQPVIKRPSPHRASRTKKPNASPPAVKPGGARSKPFSMSYDGMTQAEYIQYLLDRGSR